MDEAKRHGLQVDDRRLARDLGVPVVPASARYGVGIPELLEAIHDVALGRVRAKPYRIKAESPALKHAITTLSDQIHTLYPDLPNPRWLALRLLDGDEEIIQALQSGELGELLNLDGQLEDLEEMSLKEAAV
jgi:ferrous iron transport protein B